VSWLLFFFKKISHFGHYLQDKSVPCTFLLIESRYKSPGCRKRKVPIRLRINASDGQEDQDPPSFEKQLRRTGCKKIAKIHLPSVTKNKLVPNWFFYNGLIGTQTRLHPSGLRTGKQNFLFNVSLHWIFSRNFFEVVCIYLFLCFFKNASSLFKLKIPLAGRGLRWVGFYIFSIILFNFLSNVNTSAFFTLL